MFFRRINKILFKIEGYTNTHEYINYRRLGESKSSNTRLGRIKLPYTVWNSKKEVIEVAIQTLPVRRRNIVAFIDLQNSIIPKQMVIGLRVEEGEEERPELLLRTDKNGIAWFELVVSHRDQDNNLVDPEFVALWIRAGDPKKILLDDLEDLDEEEAEQIIDSTWGRKYEFMAGPEIGNSWIGIDPGTTGSYVVAGHPSLVNSDHELILYTNQLEREIITPSLLAFDHSKALEVSQQEFLEIVKSEIPEQAFGFFETGEMAHSISDSNYNSFQSVKKLLGYQKLKQTIRFSNEKELNLSGVELTGMMVRRLLDQFKLTLEDRYTTDRFLEPLMEERKFKPTRAVVAIPNNFNPLQIQDTVDAIRFIPHLREVRTIYESEAVLLYCVRHIPEHFGSEKFSKKILIFDMGGATINVTNVDATFDGKIYDFHITGKIGYALGGDSIDYYLGKVLVEYMPELFVTNNPFEEISDSTPDQKRHEQLRLRRDFKNKILSPMKLHITRQRNKKEENLLSNFPYEVMQALESFGDCQEITFHDDLVNLCAKQKGGKYPVFDKLSAVYKSISEAVIDAGEEHIPDKVIFSGRSTLFPYVRETVLEALKKLDSDPDVIALSEDELKTSVAKGACLYGMMSNAFRLTSDKIFENYGFTVPKSGARNDVGFVPLISAGTILKDGKVVFKKNLKGLDFSLQSNYVNFYQVNGKNPEKIIREGIKHKYKTVGQIEASRPVNASAMQIHADGIVKCGIWHRLDARPITCENTNIALSLAGENEPHYTWLVI